VILEFSERARQHKRAHKQRVNKRETERYAHPQAGGDRREETNLTGTSATVLFVEERPGRFTRGSIVDSSESSRRLLIPRGPRGSHLK